MEETLAGFAARPALAEWLIAGKWQPLFDKGTILRSLDYANANSISDVEFMDFMSDGTVEASASVKGSQRRPYNTLLTFYESRGQWTVESDCSCPTIDRCKHGAALLRFFQTKLTPVSASPELDLSLPPRPVPVDPSLIAWLREIEQASQRAGEIDAKTKPKDKSKENRFLAYCIEEPADGHRRKLIFNLRVGNRSKDGTVRLQGGTATADPSNPPGYMVREDIQLASLFRQRQRKFGGWGSMTMEGPEWDELLDGALALGRLYFGKEAHDRRGSSAYRALSAGGPEKFETYWENSPDGSARPMVRSSRPGLLLIPSQPPRYLDLEQSLIGPVETDAHPAILALWMRGPVVPAAQIPALVERFASIPTLALPPPVELETETRPALPPSPVLRLRPQSFSNYWQRLDLIIGELSFIYGDSPRLSPLSNSAPRHHSALRGGKRVVWPRDFKGERAAETRLLRLPLQPLMRIVPGTMLDESTRHAVAPPPTPGSKQELAWLQLLEGPAIAQLREEGWTIEVDPACGLTMHEATGFMPAIEVESDHGIDWFRFDATYEMDGRRFSLIPLIAEAIARNYPPADSPDLPEFIVLPCEKPEDGFIRFPARQLMEIVDQVRHLFHERKPGDPLRMDRLAAAGVADALAVDSSETTRALAKLGRSLKDIRELPAASVPVEVEAKLRHYQEEGYRWLQFLTAQGLHGILADDMGLGKTLQTLAHLAAEYARKPGRPSLVIAPTSVVPNWAAETAKFVPRLKTLVLHGANRAEDFRKVTESDVVFTSYPLLVRDFEELSKHDWHCVVLDEAQHIKNPKALTAQSACKLKAAHRLCLSGTPMENHLGELWSLMRFLMPGFLPDEKTFNTRIRKPIERDRSKDAQLALNRRVAPLILRRTKDEVAKDLPEKTEIIHGIDLNKKQTDLYESVRASMDKRVREAIAAQGLAKSHIIVLDALLKLRQICCHPQLLDTPAAKKVTDSAKLDYLTEELLPTLLEEGRRILLFSQFTSMLALIEHHLVKQKIRHLKLTGQTKDRAKLVKEFQTGEVPVFLISLKAGGTGLNLTAADTVIHYDPWWNPAAENQATDRAHRIGQTKPVFVHKLVCRGTIEERILELQKHKAALVEALLSEDTSKLKIDAETLSHLLAPL